MTTRTIRYTILPGSESTILSAIAAFLAAVRQHEPTTRYDVWRVGGSNTFVHLFSFPDPHAEQSHRDADYTQAFVHLLYPRCIEVPSFEDLVPVEELQKPGDDAQRFMIA